MKVREAERREILDVDGIIPLPGVHELLASLAATRWTIVTSCTKPLADVRIRAAGLSASSRMVTAHDITRGKPDLERYLKGAALPEVIKNRIEHQYCATIVSHPTA